MSEKQYHINKLKQGISEAETRLNYYKKVKAGNQFGKWHPDEKSEVACNLRQDRAMRFNGTDQYWKHLFGLKYTDGVKAHAEIAQAYWLLDAIASWQPQVKMHYDKHDGWMVWRLTAWKAKRGGRVAELTARADDKEPHFIRQKIEFTDHPLGTWEFWQEGDVVIIPEEH